MRETRRRSRGRAVLVSIAATLLAAAAAPAQNQAPTPASVRITMEALHQFGGVPPGWMLEPAPGDAARGRELFEHFGCHTCHAVQGADLPPPIGAGPELSGMGSHHPAAYFAEAILNPDAVIVDGRGYVGPDGRSNMPRYPDMSLAELADVIAYLRSLTDGGGHHDMRPPSPAAVAEADLPPPPASAAQRFLVQSYDVKPGQLAALESWFRQEGARQFLSIPGLLAIDTWVDRGGEAPRLVTILSFRDEASFFRFTVDPEAQRVAERFDEFIGAHGHQVLSVAPLYRSADLSAPATSPDQDGHPPR